MKKLTPKELEEISKPAKRHIISRNNVKDVITDLFGLAIWIVALILLYCDHIELWPDFCVLMIVGAILFFIPDDWIKSSLKKFISKKLG